MVNDCCCWSFFGGVLTAGSQHYVALFISAAFLIRRCNEAGRT